MSDQFELLEKLGSGGMGDVYRARDTRLNRIVAVKVLNADSPGGDQRRQRFFQEAQAASALNHPNIITIHDIVSERGEDLIVMECVNGKTLADLIPKGGLRVPLIINYGLQITDALGAAHNAGIIHRDLKPGNIMVTDRGLVKILDFGLAKLMDQPVEGLDPEATRGGGPLTIEGAIVGTIAYMSPEQAQGKKVDSRSDIFSFGAVLYEMATGQRAFESGSTLSTLAAVLRDETRPIFEISPDVPVQLERLIQRCLRKNPDDRWQSMVEVHAALLALKEISDSGTLYRLLVPPPPLPVVVPPVMPPSAVTQPPSGSRQAPPLPPPVSVTQQAPVLPPPVSAITKNAVWPKVVGVLALLLIVALGVLLWWFRQQPAVALNPPAKAPVSQPVADGVLRNNNILEMVGAKVPSSLIIRQIQSSQTDFNLSSSELIRLVQGGVPEDVIEAMRNPSRLPQPASSVSPASIPKQPPPPATPTPATTPGKSPVPPVQTPQPVEPAKSVTSATVADGTLLRLSLVDDIPVDAAEGSELHFVVVADLDINGLVVIRKGANAAGVVVGEVKKRKFFGGSTKIAYRLLTVESVDGKQLRIRATPAATVGDAAKRPLESKKSKVQGIAVPKGTECQAYVDGDAVVTVSP